MVKDVYNSFVCTVHAGSCSPRRKIGAAQIKPPKKKGPKTAVKKRLKQHGGI